MKKNTDIVRNWNYHTATGNHMPYGITQCYLPPGSCGFLAFTPTEAGTRFSDPEGMQDWVDIGWWLHPKIVYLPKMVTYLRNNQAVSCPGLEPATRKSQVQRPNHYTTRATGEYCSSSGSIIKGKFWTSFFVVNVALNCTILHIQIIMCIYIHCPFASIILMVVFSPFILLLKCL